MTAVAEREVTLLFADIEHFTEMTERLGDRGAYRVIEEYLAMVRRQAGRYRGEIVELRGDGVLLAFESPDCAVGFALAVQRALHAPGDRFGSPKVRMGLHTGPVLRNQRGYFGKHVIITSRIGSLAEASEILVSGATRSLLEDASFLRFGPPRDVRLKGLPGRRRIYEVGGIREVEPVVEGPGIGSVSPFATLRAARRRRLSASPA